MSKWQYYRANLTNLNSSHGRVAPRINNFGAPGRCTSEHPAIVLDCADTPQLQQRCLQLVRWGAEMRFSYTKGLYDTYVAPDLELASA